MRIALVQVQTTDDILENLSLATQKIREAAANGAQLIVLPEATSQAFEAGRLDTQAQTLDGEFATTIHGLARELGVYVVLGMFCPADTINREDKSINRVYNTALIAGGERVLGYDKIHVFDAYNYRESDTVKPGQELVMFEAFGTRIGVALCYDIRFPEQFRDLARAGAEVIVIPASWMDGTDKLYQWRLLGAARALDSTSFVLTAGQARPGGSAEAGKPSGPTGIGHSSVIGPTGNRLAEAGYEPEIIYYTLDLDEVAAARKALPVL